MVESSCTRYLLISAHLVVVESSNLLLCHSESRTFVLKTCPMVKLLVPWSSPSGMRTCWFGEAVVRDLGPGQAGVRMLPQQFDNDH